MNLLRNLAAFVRSLRNPVPDHAICPDDLTAIAEATGVLVPVKPDLQIRLVRVQMAADIREMTGLAECHFEEWQNELAWGEAL